MANLLSGKQDALKDIKTYINSIPTTQTADKTQFEVWDVCVSHLRDKENTKLNKELGL